ncbi:MAG: DUF86 domain-containing protein [Clostridia bacterium]|nr:DUF86 domain-containing protein [Clostridia bacterium]HBC84264.1 hypothetical protein [Clostridiales bacterium]
MIDARTKKILQAIIKHCNIISDTKIHFGDNYSDFENNNIYQNAILTPITQIGELVKRLPTEFRTQYNQIPWRNIAGMRDIVVHSYETIDKTILWNVANIEIDKIKEFCKKILNEEI